MPSQAFASLIQSDTKLENREVIYNLNLWSEQPLSLDFNSTAPKPLSKSDVSGRVVAIINSNRWSPSSTSIEEVNEPSSEFFDNLAHIPHFKRLLCNLYNVDSWVGDAHASEHRISGWKDSNALYVALNSQFS
ncbi:hypothetical protein KP803_15005 [Vibrio sp. ZSDE26]|uniref:Uncharacterized protein n=1 Tax=Vibrio amylolyticus TaxID=2847292 RepID=A0A9X1XKG0_9VIBR|nr:hypothetical protein [Vibrio amylolyticus]MCK6264587.1 hypothetical protein [Vibrio amylolyticus]